MLVELILKVKRKQIIPLVTVVMLSATIVVGPSLSRSTPYGELSALHNVPKRTGSAVVATTPAPESSQRFEAAPKMIAAGGGTSSGMTNQGGVISINGTIGQAAAGTALTPTLTQNPGAPVIYTEEGTDNVAALNSVTFARSPFRLFDPLNFSADQRTRIIFFTSDLGLTQPDASVLTVQASGANLPVENVGTLSGVPGLSGSYIIVRLPDGLPTGPLQLTITLRGLMSNITILNISAPQQFVNQPPSVNAGPDQTITLPVNSLNLVGTATDDGLPAGGALTVSWSRVSGPAPVTFSNASTATTTATFSLVGTYVLRLTANYTQLARSDDVTVTVNAATASLTPEQRVAALDAVGDRFEALLNSNPNRDAVNQELLNFIRSRPEFAQSGISATSGVWATYTDGVGLVIINRDDSDGLSAASAVSTSAVKSAGQETASRQPQPDQQMAIPTSNKARLLSALDPGSPNAIGDIRSWLQEQHYFAPVDESATIPALMSVGGDSVFYYRGLGDLYIDGSYFITSTTPVSASFDRDVLADDLKLLPYREGLRSRIIYALTSRKRPDPIIGGFRWEKAPVYGITSKFILRYWGINGGNFSANSFIYIDADGSFSQAAEDFVNAIEEKGASVYAGWGGLPLGQTKVETAKFVFDRLLGANKVYPESDGFKQRPFDYKSVEYDLTQHNGVGTDRNNSQLYLWKFKDGFTLLAPSIARMRVDEDKEELIISGIFGADPGELLGAKLGQVTVDGKDIGYTSWTNNEIKCKLPASGPGSSGDVIVTVSNHKSNVAQLNEWEGDFVLSVNTAVGSHKQQLTVHARFRADVRKWRPEIHKPPVEPETAFTATLDSYLDYLCSGSSTHSSGGSTETIIWSGAGRLPRFKEGMAGNFTLPKGEFLSIQKIHIMFTYVAPFSCTETTIDNSGQRQDILGLLNIPLYLYGIAQTTKIDTDEFYTILPDSDTSQLQTDDVGIRVAGDVDSAFNFKLTWNRIVSKHPPNPDSAR